MGQPRIATAWRRADLRCLLLLAALAAGLRAWQLTHTVVISRDAIGYTRIAWALGHGDWRREIPSSTQHPGYPLAILAVSYPVRHFLPDDLPRAMQLSAQMAAALASVLLVVPMYYLGREFFPRRVAFWAVLLFQALPVSGRLMGDGLSEPLFLLAAVTALLCACRALRRGSAGAAALVGLASGAAYLVRPEGLLVAAATGLVLLARQLRPRPRLPAARFLLCGAGLSATTLLVAVPFMGLIGWRLSLKNSTRLDLNSASMAAPPQEERGSAAGPVVLAMLFPHPEQFGLGSRSLWACKAMALTLGRASFYVFWLPALLGMWRYRRRVRHAPGAWVLVTVCGLVALALYRVAVVFGYVGERHLVLLLLCGAFPAAAVLLDGGRRLVARFRGWRREALLAAAGLLVLAVPLARTLEPLHAERAGFRAAGAWLARHAAPGDVVLDPYDWATFYAGHYFSAATAEGPHHTYVVLERREGARDHLLPLASKLGLIQELFARSGTPEPVRRWPARHGKGAEVVLYEFLAP